MKKVPIIFIVFNRPEQTKKVFAKIKEYRPEYLTIVSDGPRAGNQNDRINCPKVREIVAKIGWKCEVVRDYSRTNLGCKQRVSSGITAAFKRYDRAIILEDDCLPHPSFFNFCEELLEKYKDDNRIMSITGDNFLFNKQKNILSESYYFSRFSNIWGWATWNRAWSQYDIKMKEWPGLRGKIGIDRGLAKAFNIAYQDKINTWDAQWAFTCLAQSGLTIVPNVNMISNIGFVEQSTHTKVKTILANIPAKAIKFPLGHPAAVFSNRTADLISQSHFKPYGIIRDYIKQKLSLYEK